MRVCSGTTGGEIMNVVGASLRLTSLGGRRPRGAASRRRGTAAVVAAAVLFALTACNTMGNGRPGPSLATSAQVRTSVDAGLGLYESGEFVMAARRFREASVAANALRDRATERNAVTAECVAWMRARKLDELAECTERLEGLQRHQQRTDPGVNTLLAVGAIAGDRPIPPFRIPNAVNPIVRNAAKETP
jgi:hypothetical protein